jgi:hypothetical protein
MATPVNEQVQATLGPAGYAKQNAASVVILSWTAPADGNLHPIRLHYRKTVATLEAGGAVTFGPASAANPQAVDAGTQAAADYPAAPNATPALAKSGETWNLTQTTAMTSGASTVWAEIVGAM